LPHSSSLVGRPAHRPRRHLRAAGELDLQAILFKELTVLGNRVYQPADIDAALRMLATARRRSDR
jgi:hypothetical protein